MPMPTVRQWRSATSRFLMDRKNPLILDIDNLLAAYHQVGKTDVQKHKLLILMLYYCTQWLVSKEGKRKSWRRRHVDALLTEVENELRTPAMTQAGQNRVDAKGAVKLKENRIEMFQPRDVRQKLGLTADVSMTRLSAGRAEVFVDRQVMGGRALEPNDLVDSLKILADGNARGRLGRNLEYLSKQERLACLIQKWPDGRFHRGGSDFPYSTSRETDVHGNRIRDLFAMDEMQYIYVRAPAAMAGTLHHSSFLSGKGVICAGEIILDNGTLSYISNESGHYRPKTEDLLNCVDILDTKYEVDLARVRVADMEKQAEWNSARAFKAVRGIKLQLGRIV